MVHELLDAEPLLGRLRERWGDDVAPGGRVDRRRIGEIVFADEAELRWLEGQIHPLVRERLGEWSSTLPPGTELALAEIPLLFEGEMHEAFDLTVAVVSDDALRSARAEARGHALNAEREGLQLAQQEKAERADFVIVNDSSPAHLKERVTELWGALLQR